MGTGNMNGFGTTVRRRASAALAIGCALALGACSAASLPGLGGGKTAAGSNGDPALVDTTVTAATPEGGAASGVAVGFCPKVRLITNDETFRTYEGRDRAVDNIAYQAVLYDVTRSCRLDGDRLIIDVTAAGRLMAGPRGSRGGSLAMPIRIAVRDSQGVPYSQLETFNAAIASDRTSDQFVYRRNQVIIPATGDRRTTVLIGFDEQGA